jgi:hypothetical protein
MTGWPDPCKEIPDDASARPRSAAREVRLLGERRLSGNHVNGTTESAALAITLAGMLRRRGEVVDLVVVGGGGWFASVALAVGLAAVGLAALAWMVREANASRCPACEGQTEPGDRFCPWCGAHFATKDEVTVNDPPGGPPPGD